MPGGGPPRRLLRDLVSRPVHAEPSKKKAASLLQLKNATSCLVMTILQESVYGQIRN